MVVKLAIKPRHGANAIGQSTWTGAMLLSRAMVSAATEEEGNSSVVGKTCLELGCGTGLAGFTAMMLDCKTITFTDCSLPTLCDLRMSLSLLTEEGQKRAFIKRHVWEADSPENIGRPVRHWSNSDCCDDPLFCPDFLADNEIYDW
jgi:hypothetical protein